MISYAAYLRDSGGSEQELSIPQQEAAFNQWAAQNACPITRWYKDEARPGSSAVGREAFQSMIAYFHAGHTPETGILLWKYSRFARDIDDAQFYKADLRRHGVTLHSLTDNIPDGPEGRLIETVIDFMNDRFLQDLSTDVKRGLHHLMDTQGALGGIPPRGFQRQTLHLADHRDGTPHDVSRWVPDPITWDRCRQAWQMRAAGASYRQINATTHLYASNNCYPTFFANRLYLGELRFGDQLIPNYAPPLVDQSTWDAVQSRHRSLPGPENPDHPRRAASSYLLSGLVRCAQCHTLLNGRTVKFKTPPCEYHYYHCSRANRHAGCDARKIPAPAFETAILDDIHDYILDPVNLAAQQLLLQTGRSDQVIDLHRQHADLATRLGIVRRQLTHLVNAIADTGHTPAMVAKLRQLETDQAQLIEQLTHLDHDLAAEPPHLTSDELQAKSTALRQVLKSGDPELIRPLLHAIIKEILVTRDEDHLTILITYYHPPFEGELPISEPLYTNSVCPRTVPIYRYKTFTHEFIHPL